MAALFMQCMDSLSVEQAPEEVLLLIRDDVADVDLVGSVEEDVGVDLLADDLECGWVIHIEGGGEELANLLHVLFLQGTRRRIEAGEAQYGVCGPALCIRQACRLDHEARAVQLLLGLLRVGIWGQCRVLLQGFAQGTRIGDDLLP